MQTVSIQELQSNPAVLTRALENHEMTMITKHSTPIGIAVAFDDVIVTQELRTALLIAAYKKADLSIGQFSKAMQLSHDEAMRLLSMMGIDVIDYDFDDDLQLFEYQP
jgi:predicted HTH domain antitoxin